ncbi:MAG TPA: arylsulfotransferase family protein [Streptosporangiaceae bacterium]|nr:arylsulfotransferase family protein [Streptosporangiaceae bacterium]
MLGRGGAAVAGIGGLGGAGVVGYVWPHGTAPASSPPARDGAAAEVEHYVTRADLRPPRLRVRRLAEAAAHQALAGGPRYVFLGNKAYTGPAVGQPGLIIADRDGGIVWFQPNASGQVANFNVQTYRGQQVLTWWEGKWVNGVPYGNAYIADSSYRVIATVKAGNGLKADMHEFSLTDKGTALITANRKRGADLTAVGGAAKGAVLSGVVQEIDVATGKVLFEWDSLDHVSVAETHQALKGGMVDGMFDYFHINSIAVAPDGDLLVSARNTWTVYKIDRTGGSVRWRLGGRKSDFDLGPGATFYWQHHARPHGAGVLSLFDDGSSPPEESQSRAILLDLDTTAMRATLRHAYTHPAGLLADNQGSTQVLPDGRVFVGWGAEPYFTEYAQGGQVLRDGQLPVGDQSYRAFTADWTGHPAGGPAVVVKPNPARGSAVYVSWNGATEVQTWQVHAGTHQSSLAVMGKQARAGFETVISVNSTGPYFTVTALDANGKTLGQSGIVRTTGD